MLNSFKKKKIAMTKWWLRHGTLTASWKFGNPNIYNNTVLSACNKGEILQTPSERKESR